MKAYFNANADEQSEQEREQKTTSTRNVDVYIIQARCWNSSVTHGGRACVRAFRMLNFIHEKDKIPNGKMILLMTLFDIQLLMIGFKVYSIRSYDISSMNQL